MMMITLSIIMSMTTMMEAAAGLGSITNQEQSALENKQRNTSRKRMIAVLGLLLIGVGNALLFSEVTIPSSTLSRPLFPTITFWINPYTPPIIPITPTYTYTPLYF